MAFRRLFLLVLFVALVHGSSGCSSSSQNTVPPPSVSAACSTAWQNLEAKAGATTGDTSLASVGTGTTDFYPTLTACGHAEWMGQFSGTSIGIALADHGSSLQQFLDGMCAQAPSALACQP